MQELKEIIENGRINLLPAERVAENIIAAGYRKADEYKSEIERLENDRANLKYELSIQKFAFQAYKAGIRVGNAICEFANAIEKNKAVKQAKIDVLNEFAKKCMDGVGYGSDETIIKNYLDKFIKEIEQ